MNQRQPCFGLLCMGRRGHRCKGSRTDCRGGREGGAGDFAELCIAEVREGAARTAGGREEAAQTAGAGREGGGGGGAQGAMPMVCSSPRAPDAQGRVKEEGWPAEPTSLGGLHI